VASGSYRTCRQRGRQYNAQCNTSIITFDCLTQTVCVGNSSPSCGYDTPFLISPRLACPARSLLPCAPSLHNPTHLCKPRQQVDRGIQHAGHLQQRTLHCTKPAASQ
jgi:hypothetical protein